MNILTIEIQIVKYVESLPAWECGLKHLTVPHCEYHFRPKVSASVLSLFPPSSVVSVYDLSKRSSKHIEEYLLSFNKNCTKKNAIMTEIAFFRAVYLFYLQL